MKNSKEEALEKKQYSNQQMGGGTEQRVVKRKIPDS